MLEIFFTFLFARVIMKSSTKGVIKMVDIKKFGIIYESRGEMAELV